MAALIVAAALAWWLWRRRRVRPRLRAAPPDESWRGRPQPGEIWWADVPFSDGTGHKVRPCLVLRTHQRQVEVLKITSQDRSARRDHIEIPTGAWDRRATHNSYLDLSDPFRLRDSAFSRKAGTVDDRTWSTVRRLHATGWVA
nr:type II toxin-antitoxin system PemK/MazF family toxin [Planosporangium thailandense]